MSDQMVQAARSGRQNIAEGSRASATSSQTELRLVNVARSSLEELLLDYEDYLRHRRLRKWAPESPEALAVRESGRSIGRIVRSSPIFPMSAPALYARWLDHDDPAVRANALLCLINQANYLLDKQIEALEAHLSKRADTANNWPPPAWPSAAASGTNPIGRIRRIGPIPIPSCPQCGKPMALRTAKRGENRKTVLGLLRIPGMQEDCRDLTACSTQITGSVSE